jgi:SNF2 family DNA or RNA helicase
MRNFDFPKTKLGPIQRSILENIGTDNLSIEEDESFIISFEQALQINDLDRKSLGIPISIPFILSIGSKGTLNNYDFRFSKSFHIHSSSEIISFDHKDDLYLFGENKYIPSLEQFEILKCLAEHNNVEENTYESNLESLAKIKRIGQAPISKGMVLFDKYLEAENIAFADEIRLDFKENPDGSINILPSINHESDQGFKNSFDILPSIRSVYNSQVDEKKFRVVIPTESKNSLQTLKTQFRKVSGEMKDKVLKNPSEYFDEALFDLDHYSKRVYELGFYEPKYYPFIKPFSTNWVSGITIEEASGHRTELLLESDQEFEILKVEIEKAKNTDIKNVIFQEKDIPLVDAISLRDSYQAIKENKISKKGFRDSQGRKVLIIHENIDSIDFSSEAPTEIQHVFIAPKRLKKSFSLLPHQVEGVAWLQTLSKSNSGALLGDDMGLGKTLQILSFLDWSIEYQSEIRSDKPNLLVAPVTLLENWENEFKRFFDPHLVLIRYYGKEAGQIKLQELGRENIVLTTYETLRSKQLILGRVNWFSAVLDEAQRIKTPGTLVTNAAKAINAEFKVAMTGTPVENSWMDLWCLSDFMAPGILGSAKEFNQKYNLSLKNESTDLRALGDDIRGRLGIYLKRRTKSQILTDLPSKTAVFIPQEMPSIQEKQYDEELEHYRKNKGSLNQILTTISKLRMISDHPYLVLEPEEIHTASTEELINSSAKMMVTVSILEQIRDLNEKVILFSPFEKVQNILSRIVIEHFNLPVSIINGQTATIETDRKISRQKLIDKFQAVDGFNIIIMSPIAAGYGLNVTGANHVIHFTRHWNPAKENQATDRVYRIGQNKPVHIYYPMAVIAGKETFDQKLDGLLRMKNQLSDASLYPSESCEVKLSEFEDLLK